MVSVAIALCSPLQQRAVIVGRKLSAIKMGYAGEITSNYLHKLASSG